MTNDPEGRVVSLRGAVLPVAKDVNPATVRALTDLLRQAKAGEICGVAVVSESARGSTTMILAGFLGGYSTIGALQCAAAELISEANEGAIIEPDGE